MNMSLVPVPILHIVNLVFLFVCFLLSVNSFVFAESDSGDKKEEMNTTQFAIDLYKELTDEKKNIFFSPVSISSAVAVANEGAKGATREEIIQALRLSADQTKGRAQFQDLEKALNGIQESGAVKLSLANALWLDKKLEVKKNFVDDAKKFYSAEVSLKDFQGAPSEARVTINDWVEKKTEDRIKDLLPEGSINALTRLVVTNAIYFKGDWLEQFDEKFTQEGDFFLSDGSSVKAQLMSKELTVPFMENEELFVAELPYKGEEVSMVVILPKERGGLSAIEKGLSAEKLSGWLSRMNQTKIQLFLPRFKAETEFILNQTLAALGVRKAFSRDADFSGITEAEKLFISLIIHKAFVEVNEEGTEAAAATGLVMRALGFQPKPIFRADHPFLFFIREKRSNTILFMGRLNEPKE